MKKYIQNFNFLRKCISFQACSTIKKGLSFLLITFTILFPTHLLAANCTLSPYSGKATLNEFFKDRTTQANDADDFAEIKILDSAINSAVFDTWKIQICEKNEAGNNNDDDGCSGYVSVSDFTESTIPWIILKNGSIGDYINLKTGFDAVLVDNNNNLIDYVTVDGYGEAENQLGCTAANLPYDMTASSPGASDKFIYRVPDGTGDWDSAPSASAPPTEDDTNDPAPDGGTLPSVTVTDVTVNKGQTATFTFTLEKTVTYKVEVNYKTQGGTAVANTDYTYNEGTITFDANTTTLTQTVSIATNGTTPSTTATVYFNLYLVNKLNAKIVNAYPVGTILGNATAEWYMDEASWSSNTANEVSDISSSANHGTPYGGVSTTFPGKLCNAGSFDGTDDYIEIPHNASLNGSNQLTYSVWISPTDWSGGIRQIMAKSVHGDTVTGSVPERAQMGIFSENGRLVGRAETPGDVRHEVFTTLPTLSTWTYVVLVFNGNSLTLYINGVVAGNYSASFPSSKVFDSTTLVTTNDPLLISKRVKTSAYYFKGLIDEVLVLQSALPAAFIKTMYDNYQLGLNWNGATRSCGGIDHFSINYGTSNGTGVNCQSEAITINAHDASHNILTTYTGTINLSTSTTNGDWSKTSTASDALGTLSTEASDSGAATYSFIAGDNGSVILNFKDTHTETTNINLSAVSITETSGSAVASDDYQITFASTGFNFLADNVKDTIGLQIAGKRSDITPGNQTLELQAIKTSDDTGACESAFTNNQTVEIAVECINPTSCTGDKLYISTDGGTTFDQMDATPELTYTAITDFNFGDTADTTAPIIIRYDDVGQIRLHAKKTLSPSNIDMTGSSNNFVVRPFAFYTTITGNPAATSSTGSAFTTAGTDFTANTRAVLWQSTDDDASGGVGTANDGIADGHDDTDPSNNVNLSDNTVALNYGQETLTEQVILRALLNQPTGGNDPGLSDSSANGGRITSFNSGTGIGSTSTVNYSEVGIMELYTNVNDSNYLGIGTTETAKILGQTGYVGRFYPHHFDTVVTHGCSNIFTYSGQPFTATISARNKANATTLNYRDTYAFGVNLSDANPAAPALGTFTNATISSASFSSNSVANGSSFGVGTQASLTYTYTAKDTIPEALEIRASDQTDTAITSNGFSEDTANIRSGRMRLENVFGPELTPLTMPVKVEFYSDNGTATTTDDGYTTSTDDSCSTYDAPNGTLANFTGNLSNPEVAATGTATVASGLGSIILHKPGDTTTGPGVGNDGSVNLLLDNISSWLTYNWGIDCDGDSTNDTGACGTASFGLYRGDDRVIYWREVF